MNLIFKKKRSIIFFLIILCVGLMSVPSIYFYRKYTELKQKVETQGDKETQTRELVAKVGRHILVPVDEMPTVLTVTDKERLSGQPFFANAQNGDIVLVYQNAKKAFLYDPEADKILEVGPILKTETTSGLNSGMPATTSAVTSTPKASTTPAPTTVKFYLYNGTSTVGLTKRYESSLKNAVPGAVVVDRDNAKTQDYEKSILVDLGTGTPAQATDIAQALNIALDTLPAGESKPTDADFLIILGADKK